MTTAQQRRKARPLFVISNDYGELGLAMFFLRGQDVAARAAVTLPDRLYREHHEIVPGATYRYESDTDILKNADEHGANVVLLFSGYLATNNEILSREALGTLVARLRERGCIVVTTDPFLGLIPRLHYEHVRLDVPLSPAQEEVIRPTSWRIVEGLAAASEILRDTIHLYHRAPEKWLREQTAPSASFFNRPPTREVKGSEKRWLFVIGSEDMWLQRILCQAKLGISIEEGEEEGNALFAAVVTRLLEDAVRAGRRPVLIGPPLLIRLLPARLNATCDLRPFCPFHEFLGYILESEFVFYWNVFSASVLPRLALELPTFFFDRGHMARLILPLYELGLKLHYGGWKPRYLDQDAPLEVAALVRQWKATGLGNTAVLKAWQEASLTPDQLLEHLVNS